MKPRLTKNRATVMTALCIFALIGATAIVATRPASFVMSLRFDGGYAFLKDSNKGVTVEAFQASTDSATSNVHTMQLTVRRGNVTASDIPINGNGVYPVEGYRITIASQIINDSGQVGVTLPPTSIPLDPCAPVPDL